VVGDLARIDDVRRLADQAREHGPIDASVHNAGAGDANGHLDLAPDRRLADLELSGADRAAVAQCAEFGQ
jgi:NAD(P)-dependent dehydrogenase (short-subunit alcohol dehydrogenase family)